MSLCIRAVEGPGLVVQAAGTAATDTREVCATDRMPKEESATPTIQGTCPHREGLGAFDPLTVLDRATTALAGWHVVALPEFLNN